MAHKKAAGTAKNLRDSAGKRLGIKLFGGQTAKNGNIICRQRGTKWRPGEGVGMGVDYTIYATCDGIVTFQEKKRVRYDGRTYTYSYINVLSEAELAKRAKAPTKEAKPAKTAAPKKKAVAKKKTA